MNKGIDKIKQIRASRPFKTGDIIVYAIIICLVAMLFILTLTLGRGEEIKSINIYLESEKIYEYKFSSNKSTFTQKFIEENIEGEIIRVKVNVNLVEYNIIEINRVSKSAKMIEATCLSKDCISSNEIKTSNRAIICLPHKLKITANEDNLDEIVSG